MDDNENPGSIFDTFTDDSDIDGFSEIEVQDETGGDIADSFDSIDPADNNKEENAFQTVKPFNAEKISAREAFGAPRQLNKQLIMYVVFGIIILFIIFTTFILPNIKITKKEEEKKPKPATIEVMDYSNLVPKNGTEKNASQSVTVTEQEKEVYTGNYQEDVINTLPPVDRKYQPKTAATTQTTAQVMSSGSGAERPDTRSDRLQEKSISGIKGISSTQSNYATYDLSGSNQAAAQIQPAASSAYSSQYPSKADYTNQLLSQYAQQNQQGNPYINQNDQSGKQTFYNNGRGTGGGGSWLPLNSVWQGTIFEATLTSNISTDLPGECTARITKNVYSSQDGQYLLIPQNSLLYGSYNSSISYSQSRVQVGWHTLIRPDGYAINLGNMTATDAQGAAGLKGFINDHPFQYLKALALMSAFNIISGEFKSTADTGNSYVQNIMANSQDIANTLGSKLIDRAMDVQPSIIIKAGKQINIVANMNLMLPPLEMYEVTSPYQKQ